MTKVDVFVSLGTHPQPFPRLLTEVARLAEAKKIKGRILVQAGYTPFKHSQMEIVDFLSLSEFEKVLKECKLFITHAGEGNIGQALQEEKPMIIVPRHQRLGEHTDDHQQELAQAMERQFHMVVVQDMKNLEEAIRLASNPQKQSLREGFIPRILEKGAKENGLTLLSRANKTKPVKWSPPTSASIVVSTLNGGEPLIKAVNGMLNQDYKGKYEIIVVDDGSFDGKTPALLKKNFEKNTRVKLILLPRSGVCKARNAGIRAAQYEVIVNMDHDDNPEKDWLRVMMSGFNSSDVGAVSAYGHYGGTSTAFRKDILTHLGGYDEDYFYYREDTDLSFRIMELGFEYAKVSGAKWHGDRTLVTPKGIIPILRYTVQRFKYHMNDVLLHKKHNTRLCNQFLHVRAKLFVDPVEDFKVATGLWKENGELELSSPRGMTFLPNRGMVSFVLIVLIGLSYAFAIKWARLAGSIKYGHFLV